MTACPACTKPLLEGAPRCPWCGHSLTTTTANATNANGPGGFALAGGNAQVNITQQGNTWDTRPRTEFDRKDSRISAWLELTAAIITLAATGVGVFAGWVEKFATTGWIIAFAVAALIVVFVGFFACHFLAARLEGRSVVRVGIKHLSAVQYYIEEWHAWFGLRNRVEENNDWFKSDEATDIGNPKKRWARGYAYNFLIAGTAAAVSNMRRIVTHLEAEALDVVDRSTLRTRRRLDIDGNPLEHHAVAA
ncbi:hypothetical protein [Microbacterium phyllosphaerae]|uniref:hypothetical protein n=1 Tax=Microbacterium phyllosphaerae TaxID=124798 RepID=UPI000EA38042|nr:hypothetical protein [Microbacterium phyllosphaerae]